MRREVRVDVATGSEDMGGSVWGWRKILPYVTAALSVASSGDGVTPEPGATALRQDCVTVLDIRVSIILNMKFIINS
jgi:hypothetical protein